VIIARQTDEAVKNSFDEDFIELGATVVGRIQLSNVKFGAQARRKVIGVCSGSEGRQLLVCYTENPK
jgi:hypothetical protein